MSAANYAACLAVTLRWEGGFSDHPADPGGATMRGVTQKVYDGFRAARGLYPQTVRKISEHELQAIYRKQYWDVVRGDDLPPGLDLAVFDYAVNSGPVRAVKALQAILGVVVDGHLGEATLGAIRDHLALDLAQALCDRRLAFMKAARDKKGRRLWPTFGVGWTNRVADIRRRAAAMARGAPAAEPAREPLSAPPDIEADPVGKAIDAAPPPAPSTDKAIALGTAGAGALAAIVGAIQSPWGVAALAILVVAAGLAAWRLWPRPRMPEMTP